MQSENQTVDLDVIPVMPLGTFIMLISAIAIGTVSAVLILPSLLPGLTASLLGSEPKAFWYLSRSSAMVAFGFLWLAMALGIMITNKMARIWPGGPRAYDMHQYASLLGLTFAIFHALILLGDSYITYTIPDILIPFKNNEYRPVWVGLGQVAIYLLLMVILSFYLRKQIGRRGWRIIHFFSYAVFLMALIHGVMAGTDTQSLGVDVYYWSLLASILFLTTYRVLTVIPVFSVKKRTTS